MSSQTKTIGFFHFQVGRTDGVSLEIDKWRTVLENLGHRTYLFGGDVGQSDGICIPEMFHHTPQAERLTRATFHTLADFGGDEAAYRRALTAAVARLYARFEAEIDKRQIDFLIPQNVWSVAANPAVGLALAQLMRRRTLPTLAQSHDFYWERHDGVALTCRTALQAILPNFPPRHAQVQHVVINSLARQHLLDYRGIQATVVPNVFDFAAPAWQPDDYNADLRHRLGLHPNDVVFLQATRLVSRKGIELAVDFMQALNQPQRRAILQQQGLYNGRPFAADNRIVLLLAGYAADDESGYVNRLRDKIKEAGIEAMFIGDMIDSERGTENGEKIYSLWDAYVHADFVTYPSLWEGWGNQLLEALRARLPILLFEYPVYEQDIKPTGLQMVSLGNKISGADERGLATIDPAITEQAADEAVTLLSDRTAYQRTVDHNFAVGETHFSIPALEKHLRRLMNNT